MYYEVQRLLHTFSEPTLNQGQEDVRIKFKQICADNEIPKSSWGGYFTLNWKENLHVSSTGSFNGNVVVMIV